MERSIEKIDSAHSEMCFTMQGVGERDEWQRVFPNDNRNKPQPISLRAVKNLKNLFQLFLRQLHIHAPRVALPPRAKRNTPMRVEGAHCPRAHRLRR